MLMEYFDIKKIVYYDLIDVNITKFTDDIIVSFYPIEDKIIMRYSINSDDINFIQVSYEDFQAYLDVN